MGVLYGGRTYARVPGRRYKGRKGLKNVYTHAGKMFVAAYRKDSKGVKHRYFRRIDSKQIVTTGRPAVARRRTAK